MTRSAHALAACTIASLLSSAALAQATSSAATPVPAAQAAPAAIVVQPAAQQSLSLPANTEILLSMNQDLTTKGGKIEEGHTFGLSVVHDVRVGDYVVIPKGTGATGEVTWKTGKGAFGKSGKMEIALRYVDLSGRRIPVDGTYRQEGEGNTVATVAGVVAAGVFAAFITGKSARIPQGRELKAFTKDALPIVVQAAAPAPASVPVVVQASTPAPQPAAAPVAAPGDSD